MDTIKKINIEPTMTTPFIDAGEGYMIMEGSLFDPNPKRFFKPIMYWADAYPFESIEIDIDLHNINTAGLKYLFTLLRAFDINDKVTEVTINWNYESDGIDMLKTAQETLKGFDNFEVNYLTSTKVKWKN